jgi:hypothetical protein
VPSPITAVTVAGKIGAVPTTVVTLTAFIDLTVSEVFEDVTVMIAVAGIAEDIESVPLIAKVPALA